MVERNGELLIVQRGAGPNAGRWGFPGGKLEPGETLLAAAERELNEETGVTARAERALPALDVIGHNAEGKLAWHYVLVPVLCAWQAGDGVAASDAAAVRWIPRTGLQSAELDLVEQFPLVLQQL